MLWIIPLISAPSTNRDKSLKIKWDLNFSATPPQKTPRAGGQSAIKAPEKLRSHYDFDSRT